jgi:hypothetical protein
MKKIGLFLFVITALGCSREPIDGAVYVIKGDGKITPAAAIDIHALPFKSVSDFDEARVQLEKTISASSFRDYLSDMCEVFSQKKQHRKNIHLRSAERYSSQCGFERQEFQSLTSNKKDPDTLKTKVAVKKGKEREILFNTIASKLTQKELENIEVNFDYSLKPERKWATATITNNSTFWIDNGGDDLVMYVGGLQVGGCRVSEFPLAPGGKLEISLGDCYSRPNKDKAIEQGAKVCREDGDDYTTLCFDEIGVSCDSGGWWAEDCRKQWVFRSSKNSGGIDFGERALESLEIKNLDREIAIIESQLKKSHTIADNLSNCNHLQSKISAFQDLTCPVGDLERSDVTSFVSYANEIGVPLDEVPTYQLLSIEDFSQLRGLRTIKTNIDGNFVFDNPPNSEFLFYAKYQDNFNTMEWMVPVEIDVKSIELNNTNSL